LETSSSNKQEKPQEASTQGPSPLATLARQELERRRRANPLKYFIPNGAIESLVNAIGEHQASGKFIFVLPAANSVGKSAAAIAILGAAMYGPPNEWFDFELFHNWPYPKKFWYISEQTTLKETICGIGEGADASTSEIRKWMPEGRYEFNKAGLEYFSHFVSDTGWTGSFKTFDQLPSKFESDKVGIIVLDEPPPEPIFNACLARLTLGGIIIMPMTPLFSAGWVADRLVNESNPNPHVYVLRADIEENCFDGDTEYLTQDGWKLLSEATTDDVAATYNLKLRRVEYQQVQHTVAKPYNGKLVRLNDTGVRCTPNHRIPALIPSKGKRRRQIGRMAFGTVEAGKLAHGMRLLPFAEDWTFGHNHISPFPDKVSGADWCEMLGWLVSEGWAEGTRSRKGYGNRVGIAQTKSVNRAKIKELLSRTA
jgi:phage terminase large subunit-like protein